jgi:hypothetical protein
LSTNPSLPRRGEIWRVNLDPTLGAEIKKTRPAVVVSTDAIGRLPIKLIAPITEWNPPFGDRLETTIKTLSEEQSLEFGCALECGSFELRISDNEQWGIEASGDETALISFFLGLLSRLQKLGTVPAMDIAKYAKALEE